MLDHHLGVCASCRSRAGEIAGLEQRLRAMFGSRWGATPLPLLDQSALSKQQPSRTMNLWASFSSRQLAGTALVTALLTLAMWVTLWPSNAGGSTALQPPTVTAPLSPVTGFERTATRLVLPGCSSFVHVVGQDETISSISALYSVDSQVLMAYNGLEGDRISAGTVLMIPDCRPTPLTGSKTPAHTLTFTPRTEHGSNTP